MPISCLYIQLLVSLSLAQSITLFSIKLHQIEMLISICGTLWLCLWSSYSLQFIVAIKLNSSSFSLILLATWIKYIIPFSHCVVEVYKSCCCTTHIHVYNFRTWAKFASTLDRCASSNLTQYSPPKLAGCIRGRCQWTWRRSRASTPAYRRAGWRIPLWSAASTRCTQSALDAMICPGQSKSAKRINQFY